MEKAIIGGGCFWCTEAVYQELNGVEKVVSGYAGGHVPNPTYEQIGTKTTGHAEVIEVTYDPAIIPYEEILLVFFKTHDPTTLNQQGGDKGPQYRSTIMYTNDEQKAEAEKTIKVLSDLEVFGKPIVTEVVPLDIFYPAEDYHQNYYKRTGNKNPYCTYVIDPKLKKFRALFGERLK